MSTDQARLLLHCRGLVQGVGLRPLVHGLARRLDLAGTLDNIPGAVRLDLQGARPALEQLLRLLPELLVPPARLDGLEIRWCPPRCPSPRGLHIGAAATTALGPGLVTTALAPDLAPCGQCRAELADPKDRRHRYPFISCRRCGPRLSIAVAEPWMRSHTTLAAFPLCDACRREFNDPLDRRFHAETIGCSACGPRLQLLAADGRALAQGDESCLAAAVALLRQGGILALQAVGGFQLLVPAADGHAVERLRRRKRRPHRPFAVLVDDPGRLAALVALPPGALAALHDPAAPIVLLPRQADPGDPRAAEVAPPVAAGSPWQGVMLPASPLQLLLARDCGCALVATSGNPSGEPLCIDPAEARRRLALVADGFLFHDRPIARPLDDSVVQLVDGNPVLLRRARGHAPAPLRLPQPPAADRGLLALGGDLKAAPALLLQGTVWLAPHRGDLISAAVERGLAEGLQALLDRWGPGLQGLVCDSHPAAIGGRLADELAASHHLPLRRVPHHHAHAWAVAAEHGAAGPLLAWAADGLGYADGDGDDHRLRGCELLLLQRGQPVRRLACLRPLPLPGGDRAAVEPRRCALGLLHEAQLLDHPGAQACLRAFSPGALPLLLAALDQGLQAPLASSLGRLWDGFAAVLGLLHCQTHEGQAALLLESLAAGPAAAAVVLPSLTLPLRPARSCGQPPRLDWQPLLRRLLDLRQNERVPMAPLALWLHRSLVVSLVRGARWAARRHGCRQVILSGGCFQNALLLDGCRRGLAALGLEPLWSQQIPANDGGLALGQLWAVLQSA